ncbi:hypothetical protein RCL_jg14176.t1 [Rhizophagus clarus]|uniref:Uncharacterized protein n=1 Tax=Rhizophagus clarus TaxID=94130 RepID=A0A8H3LSM0_9GLOM|nr:hypothetical protein RCL_jg14176.t1 [Rhizophagus clarus]
MSSSTSNTTTNFINTALYEEFYNYFKVTLVSANWTLSHSSLFAKNVSKDEYQNQIAVSDPVIPQLDVMLILSSSSTLKPDAKSFILKDKKVKTIESDPDATHIIIDYHPMAIHLQYPTILSQLQSKSKRSIRPLGAFKKVKNPDGQNKMIVYFKFTWRSHQQTENINKSKANNKSLASTSKNLKIYRSSYLVVTDFNHIPIRSLLKNSDKSSTGYKADKKIKLLKIIKA